MRITDIEILSYQESFYSRGIFFLVIKGNRPHPDFIRAYIYEDRVNFNVSLFGVFVGATFGFWIGFKCFKFWVFRSHPFIKSLIKKLTKAKA